MTHNYKLVQHCLHMTEQGTVTQAVLIILDSLLTGSVIMALT